MHRVVFQNCLVYLCFVFGIFLATGLGAESPAQAATPTEPVDPRGVLDEAVRALGPIDRFDRLPAVRFTGLSGDGESEGAPVDMLMVFPEGLDGLWMQSLFENEGTVFDRQLAGDRSWSKTLGVLPPELHRDAVRYASTKLLTLLRYRHHPDAEVRLEGIEQVDGEEVRVVRVTLYGHPSYLEVAPSGRVVAVRFPSSDIQEQVEDQWVRRTYDDYREVDGFRLPFRQQVTVGGEFYNVWQLDSLELDPDFDPAIFEPPADGSESD